MPDFCAGSGHPRYVSGCPGDLQIESTGIGITVDDLTGKIQPGHFLGLHGFWIDLRHFHTAGSNDRFRNRTFAGDR